MLFLPGRVREALTHVLSHCHVILTWKSERDTDSCFYLIAMLFLPGRVREALTHVFILLVCYSYLEFLLLTRCQETSKPQVSLRRILCSDEECGIFLCVKNTEKHLFILLS